MEKHEWGLQFLPKFPMRSLQGRFVFYKESDCKDNYQLSSFPVIRSISKRERQR